MVFSIKQQQEIAASDETRNSMIFGKAKCSNLISNLHT
jgi:hypothetical protein